MSPFLYYNDCTERYFHPRDCGEATDTGAIRVACTRFTSEYSETGDILPHGFIPEIRVRRNISGYSFWAIAFNGIDIPSRFGYHEAVKTRSA